MRTLIIAACLLAGFGAAYTLTAQASSPVTLPDLPGLGYSLSMQFNAQTQCGNYVVVSGNGVSREVLIGDLPPRCSTAQQEADRIAALLNEFPPPGAQPATTTVYATTTALVTVQADPLPAVTTTVAVTTPAVTLPAVTVASPPVERTVTETVIQTVTVAAVPANDTAVPADPEWLVALAVRSQGLNDIFGLA